GVAAADPGRGVGQLSAAVPGNPGPGCPAGTGDLGGAGSVVAGPGASVGGAPFDPEPASRQAGTGGAAGRCPRRPVRGPSPGARAPACGRADLSPCRPAD